MDVLNAADYSLSKQLDIIVYNPYDFMPVYEDDDIAILSPEALSHVIEVKGMLTNHSLHDAVLHLEDFCHKWKSYSRFKLRHHESSNTKTPRLFVFAWQTKSLSTDLIRKRLCKHVQGVSTAENHESQPKIETVFIFGHSETTFTLNVQDKVYDYGYVTGQRPECSF